MPKTRVVQTYVVRSGTTSHFNQIWLWAVIIACVALLFAIISVAAPGWYGTSLMKNCHGCLSTTVLSFFGIFFLILGIISTILFAKRLITSFSNTIKVSAIILFTLAGIFIVAAYTSIISHNPNNYSYYL